MAVDGGQPAAMRDLDLSSIAAGPARGDHLSRGRGHDRAAPGGAEVDAGVETREMQDRMIAITEARSDRPRHRGEEAHADRSGGPLGVDRVDPLAAAVRR